MCDDLHAFFKIAHATAQNTESKSVFACMVALHECMNICEESPPLSFRRLCVADREKAVQEPFQRCTYIFHTKGVREWKHIVVRQGEVMARVQLLLKSVAFIFIPQQFGTVETPEHLDKLKSGRRCEVKLEGKENL